MRNHWKIIIGVLLFACSGVMLFWVWQRGQAKQPIPLPVVAQSTIVEGAGYSLYRWEAGLQLVVLYDGAYTTNACTIGSVDTVSSTVYGCRIPFHNGTITTWSVQTTDGKTGILSVDGRTYQLPREAPVIWVQADGGENRITAFQRNLPMFQNDTAERQLHQWLVQDPELSVFATRFGLGN